MKKVLVFLFLFLFPVYVHALSYPDLNSKIIEVYDLTENKVLYEVESKDETAIASLTKIATTITAIESVKDLNEEVTVTNKMLNTVSLEASKAGLKAGDKLSYLDLLYASMLPSGADATNVIAIASSESVDNFVKKMNNLAKKLKLKNTHFVNTSGLDIENHYSSASDVRKLLTYALKNSLFKKIYTTKKYTLSNGLVVKSTLSSRYNTPGYSTDKLLGSKTGYTSNAGYCLSSLSNINGHEFIIITIKANKIDTKFYNVVDTVKLINFLELNYKDRVLIKEGELLKTIPVNYSKINKYEVKASKDVTKYLPSDYDKKKFKYEYEGLEKLSFRNKKGSKIGEIKYYYDGEQFYKENVILNQKLKISFIKIVGSYWYIIAVALAIILAVYRGRMYKYENSSNNRVS